MLCALTVRRLKPGSLDRFKEIFESSDPPEGWTAAYVVRNVEDENEVISFGLFDGSVEQLRATQEAYKEFVDQIEPLVESVGTDGLYEVELEMKA